MKRISIVIAALLVFIAMPAMAEQSTPAQEQLFKSGTKKIVAGVVLSGVGAIVLPLTGINEKDAPHAASAALIIGGAGLTLWGVRDRYNATRPQVTFGATVGRTNSVYVRRQW
jgi:hypothetical protein